MSFVGLSSSLLEELSRLTLNLWDLYLSISSSDITENSSVIKDLSSSKTSSSYMAPRATLCPLHIFPILRRYWWILMPSLLNYVALLNNGLSCILLSHSSIALPLIFSSLSYKISQLLKRSKNWAGNSIFMESRSSIDKHNNSQCPSA